MGLCQNEKMPYGAITLDEAYAAVIDFLKKDYDSITLYYNNEEANLNNTSSYHRGVKKMVDYLIFDRPVLNDLEKTVILIEVICGYLEHFYHESDGQYKMAAYALAIVTPNSRNSNDRGFLTEDEKTEILETNPNLYSKLHSHNQLRSSKL
ncbi:MAG: hypothetical protein ACRCSB_00815 [Bacteroidales bacterium]